MGRDSLFIAYRLREVILFLLISVHGINSRSRHKPLRIDDLHFITPVEAGEDLRLHCEYYLGDDTLYNVKWYKNDMEFFRYEPDTEPQFRYYYVSGINVDKSRSDIYTVYLRNLTLESSGDYMCEVSGDAPYFNTEQAIKKLVVIVPPSDGPFLTEQKTDYEIVENVTIVCNSGKAKPVPELNWYINDQLENTDSEVIVYPDELESSSVVLNFHLEQNTFQDGKVELKCVSTFRDRVSVAIKEITQTEQNE